MVVIAIVGVLVSLAGYSISSVNDIGRINGAAQVVANALRNARARAITERCAHVVQINGPTYNPGAAPPDVPRTPNTVLIWRKNNCAATVGAYVPGLAANLRDRLVDQYNLAEFGTEIDLPATLVTGNRLTTQSLSLGWQANGTRMIWADDDADGVSVDTTFVAPLGMTLRAIGMNPSPTRVVNVPLAGPAGAP